MGKYYQKFLGKQIDLAPLGIKRRDNNYPYFCTPRGASIIGWAGVDGIHYCFIRGFGEIVFAVNPMEIAPNYVHPLAGSFEDFLRLLLACRDANLLEQAWHRPAEEFYKMLEGGMSDQSVYDTLEQIREAMHLTPMEKPWEYMKELQDGFDYSKIKYTEDFYDPDMNENAPPEEWAVYYDGSIYGHSGRSRAGKEIPVEKEFQFADRKWFVPAVYSCSQGLVVDLCMRVDAEEYQRFYDKLTEKLSERDEDRLPQRERMQAELENPLNLDICPEVCVNGKKLKWKGGGGTYYTPSEDSERNNIETVRMMEHYHLDNNFAWSFVRARFPWATGRRPEIKTLELTLTEQPSMIPGDIFEVNGPGDQVTIKVPGNRGEFTLTVQKYEQQTLDTESVLQENMEYPTQYTLMSYTLSPEPEQRVFTINALGESDQPRPKSTNTAENTSGCYAAAIGIIGGVDGPTAICIGAPQEDHLFAVCSALHFEPEDHVQWYPIFRGTVHEALKIKLI